MEQIVIYQVKLWLHYDHEIMLVFMCMLYTALKQSSSSPGCRAEPVSQFPGFPLLIQWHWTAGYLFCYRQT